MEFHIQKFVASFLGRNWVAIPHVTHNDDAGADTARICRFVADGLASPDVFD